MIRTRMIYAIIIQMQIKSNHQQEYIKNKYKNIHGANQ